MMFAWLMLPYRSRCFIISYATFSPTLDKSISSSSLGKFILTVPFCFESIFYNKTNLYMTDEFELSEIFQNMSKQI